MLSVEAAIERLLGRVRSATPPEAVSLDRGLRRVLAEEIIAPIDVPPADNSAMDGYAIRHDDWDGPARALPLSQRIPAGIRPEALRPGTAARIFTGAEIPGGADTVVMQEHCRDAGTEVFVEQCPPRGANIRARGQDMERGRAVLAPGRRLDAPALGLIASLGIAEFQVRRRLRVAVVSNGSELVEPGQSVAPGQIYNSNRYLLAALVRGWGFELVDCGIAPDDPEAISRLLRRAASDADVILSSGGVSVGEEDHIKDVVGTLGAIDLWKVAIKPGKPFAFGRVADTPFLGLPGNPASVLVTALIIARPFLLALQGRSDLGVLAVRKRARFSARGGARQVYIRARERADGVEAFPQQSSGVLMSAVWGNGLVVQRPDQTIDEGDLVDFLPYDRLA